MWYLPKLCPLDTSLFWDQSRILNNLMDTSPNNPRFTTDNVIHFLLLNSIIVVICSTISLKYRLAILACCHDKNAQLIFMNNWTFPLIYLPIPCFPSYSHILLFLLPRYIRELIHYSHHTELPGASSLGSNPVSAAQVCGLSSVT